MRPKSLVSIGTEKRGGSHQPHTYRAAPAGGITHQQSSWGAVLVYCKAVAASSGPELGFKAGAVVLGTEQWRLQANSSEFALPGSSFSLLEPLNGFP